MSLPIAKHTPSSPDSQAADRNDSGRSANSSGAEGDEMSSSRGTLDSPFSPDSQSGDRSDSLFDRLLESLKIPESAVHSLDLQSGDQHDSIYETIPDVQAESDPSMFEFGNFGQRADNEANSPHPKWEAGEAHDSNSGSDSGSDSGSNSEDETNYGDHKNTHVVPKARVEQMLRDCYVHEVERLCEVLPKSKLKMIMQGVTIKIDFDDVNYNPSPRTHLMTPPLSPRSKPEMDTEVSKLDLDEPLMRVEQLRERVVQASMSSVSKEVSEGQVPPPVPPRPDRKDRVEVTEPRPQQTDAGVSENTDTSQTPAIVPDASLPEQELQSNISLVSIPSSKESPDVRRESVDLSTLTPEYVPPTSDNIENKSEVIGLNLVTGIMTIANPKVMRVILPDYPPTLTTNRPISILTTASLESVSTDSLQPLEGSGEPLQSIEMTYAKGTIVDHVQNNTGSSSDSSQQSDVMPAARNFSRPLPQPHHPPQTPFLPVSGDGVSRIDWAIVNIQRARAEKAEAQAATTTNTPHARVSQPIDIAIEALRHSQGGIQGSVHLPRPNHDAWDLERQTHVTRRKSRSACLPYLPKSKSPAQWFCGVLGALLIILGIVFGLWFGIRPAQ